MSVAAAECCVIVLISRRTLVVSRKKLSPHSLGVGPVSIHYLQLIPCLVRRERRHCQRLVWCWDVALEIRQHTGLAPPSDERMIRVPLTLEETRARRGIRAYRSEIDYSSSGP